MQVSLRVSVIIPVYNDSKNLKKCLESIFISKCKNFEVIVSDDGSSDNSYEVATQFPYKIIRLMKNKGAATARNIGAKHATGDILYFVDSDTVQGEDTIENIIRHYEENKNIDIICGYWAKDSLKKGAFPEFIGLKHFYLMILAKMRNKNNHSCSIINPSSFAIKKSVFEEIGGFNQKYHSSVGEDYELSQRISEKGYNVYSFKDMCIKHHFKEIIPTFRLIFQRTSVWITLFIKKKRFEKWGNATKSEAVTTMVVFFATLSFILGFISIYYLFLSCLLLVVLSLRNFAFYFVFIPKEKGATFIFPAILFDYLLYLCVGLGALYGLAKKIKELK